jgi:hypothetical protein
VARQLPFTEAVIKETLRLLPPGAIATRTVGGKGGYQVTPEVGTRSLPQLAGCASLIVQSLAAF